MPDTLAPLTWVKLRSGLGQSCARREANEEHFAHASLWVTESMQHEEYIPSMPEGVIYAKCMP